MGWLFDYMAKREEKKENLNETKNCWHPYKLQSLSPEKFVQIVEKILKGELNLLSSSSDKK